MKLRFTLNPHTEWTWKDPHDKWVISSEEISWFKDKEGIFLPVVQLVQKICEGDYVPVLDVVQFIKLLCEGKYGVERGN